ncbi:hypothetical protein FHS13_000778 [Nocardiopsis algeriensis]|uniref:Uncharacterized protein n=1 Tax=Nocardiopsis algeriensis TaxID=1478215 RepID=A0A841INJ0_9ACTN|nr:hypothetical protein [Nocardiopsis algeriensis]
MAHATHANARLAREYLADRSPEDRLRRHGESVHTTRF